jgi:predicted permease
VEISTASPGYFQTVGIPLRGGRLFTEQDRADGDPVALVSESLARHVFGGRDPIGARVSTNNGQTWVTIVGVVGDTRRTLDASPGDALYRPLAQASPLTALYLMRTAGPMSGTLAKQAREKLYSVDPNQPADQFRTLEQARAQSVEAPRLTAMLMGLFAVLAVMITAAGLGGVIAFSVNQRRQEFGVRMALGATRDRVLAMVLRQGLTVVVSGLAVGLVVSIALTRVLSSYLYDTTPTDPTTVAAVAVALIVAGALACLGPAWRATRVDPMVALRVD